MVGTIEVSDGLKIACPTPNSAASPITHGIVSTSRIDKTPIAPIATRRNRSPNTSRRLRSKRSASTPANRLRSTTGSVQAMPTIASAPGSSFVSS